MIRSMPGTEFCSLSNLGRHLQGGWTYSAGCGKRFLAVMTLTQTADRTLGKDFSPGTEPAGLKLAID
jgi:hypothetical protein